MTKELKVIEPKDYSIHEIVNILMCYKFDHPLSLIIEELLRRAKELEEFQKASKRPSFTFSKPVKKEFEI